MTAKRCPDSKDLPRIVASTPVGKTVTVKLSRKGKVMDRQVKLELGGANYRRCMILRSMPSNKKGPDIASASVPDTLAALHVNPETGLTRAEVDARRKEHGYNEVTERRGHPVLKFLGKFWGVSAWMLELIMVLSAVLRKYSDLAVVSALLVVNAVLSFAQEHRAAGVVETLRRRLQVSARVLRDANWQVIPARELVPGDIVRVRPGDIIPADVKLLTGALSVDQSALTGESMDVDIAPAECSRRGPSSAGEKATAWSY